MQFFIGCFETSETGPQKQKGNSCIYLWADGSCSKRSRYWTGFQSMALNLLELMERGHVCSFICTHPWRWIIVKHPPDGRVSVQTQTDVKHMQESFFRFAWMQVLGIPGVCVCPCVCSQEHQCIHTREFPGENISCLCKHILMRPCLLKITI